MLNTRTPILLQAALWIWAAFVICAGSAHAQIFDDSIISKHVRLRLPAERLWLGRESIGTLEKAWAFIDAASNAKMPSRIMVVIDVQRTVSDIDTDRGTIWIGLGDRAAAKNPRDFVVHSAVREMARMAIMNLSGGAAGKPENLFLLEAISEMLAHEFSGSVRSLTAAWAITYCRDRISPLGWKRLSAGPAYSRHTLHSAAAGITLLSTVDDLYGRQRLLRFFESLAKKSLDESVAAAFKATVPALEEQWLARVRKYDISDITVTGEDEVPILDRVIFEPDPGRSGNPLIIRVYAHDGAQDLPAHGVFVMDQNSGRVLNAEEKGNEALTHAQCVLPLAGDTPEGKYMLRIVAIDEAGNLRNWDSSYAIKR